MPYLLQQLIFLILVSTLLLFFILLLYALFECYDSLARLWTKRKILRNPLIGFREGNTWVYESRGYIYRYRLKEGPIPRKKATVEWVSRRKRINPVERSLSHTSRFWLLLFYGIALDMKVVIGILLVSIFLCFGLLIPPSLKEALFAQLVTRATGMRNVTVNYEKGGWLKLEATRDTAVDHRLEPFEVRIHPLHWIIFGRPAKVTRYRDQPYGSVTYDVTHDALGRPNFQKDGKWVRGFFEEGRIVWEEPQGTGIRERKVLGHDLRPMEKTKQSLIDEEAPHR